MPKSLLITVTDDQKANTRSVADRLQKLGLKVDTVLPIGVIGGTAEERDIPKLRSCPGVATLDEDTGAEIQ
jgi:hypothetical protein